MKISINSSSCKGLDHKTNEDYCFIQQDGQHHALIILADGMGGLPFGHIASRMVSHAIANYMEQHRRNMPPDRLLKEAVNHANKVIREECYRRNCKMGATIALLLIQDEMAYYTTLGNVRLYAKTASNFTQLSADHVYAPTAYQTYLTKSINGKAMEEEAEINAIETKQILTFLLCTDGCYMNYTTNDLANLEKKMLTSNSWHDDNSYIEVILR